MDLYKKKSLISEKNYYFIDIDIFNHITYFSIFKKNILLRFSKNNNNKFFKMYYKNIDLINKYNYYFYNLINTMQCRNNEIKNVVKINFTKSNIFSSVLVEKFGFLEESFLKNSLIFTISLGTFNKLTKFTGWKKKNVNFVVMLSNFLYNILINSGYMVHTLWVKNIKKNFIAMLPVLQNIKFKYLVIKDKSFFSKVKTKKKANIKRRFSRKMTYMCPIKT